MEVAAGGERVAGLEGRAVELDHAHEVERLGLFREVGGDGVDEVLDVEHDVYKDVQRSHSGLGDRNQTAVRVVHEEVSGQNRRLDIFHAAGAVVFVSDDHDLAAGDFGEHVGEHAGVHLQALRQLEDHRQSLLAQLRFELLKTPNGLVDLKVVI